MPFDPDAYLAGIAAPAAAPAGFDPDAFLAGAAPAAPAPSPELAGATGSASGEGPGLISAVGHGVARGLTLDWSDEIESGLRSLSAGTKYRDELAAVRNRYVRNADAHPIGEGLGNLIGSVLTGVGTAGIGTVARVGAAGAKGAALVAGVESAVQGAGASTKQGLGVVEDAAKQGIVGAGLGAVIGKALGSYVDAAPARADRDLMTDLFDMSTPTARRKASDAMDRGVPVAQVARDRGLADLAGNPKALAEAVATEKSAAGKGIGAAYDELDGTVSFRDAVKGLPRDDAGEIISPIPIRSYDDSFRLSRMGAYRGDVDADAASAPLKKIPLDNVFGNQATVAEGDLMRFAAAGKNTSDRGMKGTPIVLREPDGTFTVVDGHHRLAAAKLRGEQDVNVRVINNPGKTGRTDLNDLPEAGTTAAGSGVPSAQVFDALESLQRNFKGPSDKPLRDRLKSYVEEARANWGGLDSVPLKDLNTEIGKLEKAGFRSADLDPGESARLKRQVASALNKPLQERIKQIGGKAAADLPNLNREYQALSLIERAAQERSRREPFSPTGLRDIAREQMGNSLPLAAGFAAAGGDLLAGGAVYTGGRVLKKLGDKANRAATESLARLMRGAKTGDVSKQAALDAIRAGVPLATVRGVISLSSHLPDWLPDLPGGED